jgi:hypothetical protein
MFAQRRLPPSFQFVVPFLVAAAALQMIAVQHAVAATLSSVMPLSALVSNLG